MTFTIPIYIVDAAHDGDTGQLFTVRPLFFDSPSITASQLARALEKLRSALLDHLLKLSKLARHDELAAWSHVGDIQEATLKLRLELKSKSLAATFYLVGIPSLGRELWHSPSVPALWFEVLPGQQLHARATEVYTHHLREAERESEAFDMERYTLPPRCKARLTFIELTLSPSYALEKEAPSQRMAIFGSEEKMNGEQELRRVGRRLDTLYPDELQRSVRRDDLAQELAAKMQGRTRRAVLITGPRLVGKSALLQEAVHLIMRSKPERRRNQREVWLISPMRLISGMSHVGQWENRLLAILAHAEKQQVILCFDDLLGLLEAGKSASNDLNVAQVLKPWLEQRRVRLVAESTPEVLRVLRERDRTLADAFELLPIEEPDEDATTHILIHITRDLERLHDCRFEINALSTIMDLQRRFVRDAVFPGKGAAFLKRMAIKHTQRRISQRDVLAEFRERSGISLAMLDDQRGLSRDHILGVLGSQLRGQNHVLHAFADVLMRLKSRLNDPARPLAAMLLLGPTGVGKTEAAKALAKHLFGDAARLLRFDMNEMTDATAVARLTGSPSAPDGLLTNAIRRQPFAVVLFDEIEKAAPEVFDLLLTVLDEGRLTDALGRVADFTNAVVLLTSNLGARAAQTRLGFQQAPADSASDDRAFISAAENFFRPEFFNRLDAVLPFRDLDEHDLLEISEAMITSLLQRDGLRQRSCFVRITDAAKTRLASLGHHPQLGARALKRVLEREVAEPLALELASMTAVEPLRIVLDTSEGEQGFSTTAQPIHHLPRSILWPERLAQDEALAREVLPLCFDALDRIESLIDEASPSGPVELTALTRAQTRYYQWREQFQRVQDLADAAEFSLLPKPKASARSTLPVHLPHAPARKLIIHGHRNVSVQHDREIEVEHLRSELNESFAAQTEEFADTPVVELVRELALLELIVTTPDDERSATFQYAPGANRVLGASAMAIELVLLLNSIFGDDCAVLGHDKKSLSINTPAARAVAAQLTGPCWCDHPWLADSLILGAVTLDDESVAVSRHGPVEVIFRMHDDLGDLGTHLILVDLRSGIEFNSDDRNDTLRPMLLSALPLPEELREILTTDDDTLQTLSPKRPKMVTKHKALSDSEIPF